MNNLEIKHLRMICALAECGNMTRAAEKLCLSQSALSQQLKDIEGRLGTDLFFRTRRKMIISESGRQLQETALEVLEAVDRTERAISRKTKGEKGELRIGTQCIFCYKWLPQLLKSFHATFPNIEIEMGNSVDVPGELEARRYDLIICGSFPAGETHTAVPLFKDQLVAVMPQDHPLAAGNYVRLEDFGGCTLLSHAEKSRNRFYQDVLKVRGVEPRKVMNIGAAQAIIEMVSAGFGIAVFPRWAISDALHAFAIAARPITPGGFPLTWNAVHLKHNNIPIYQQEFIRSISRLKVTERFLTPQRRETAA